MGRMEVKITSQEDMIHNLINIIVRNFVINYEYNLSTLFEFHTKKLVCVYMSIFHQSGARLLQRLSSFKIL